MKRSFVKAMLLTVVVVFAATACGKKEEKADTKKKEKVEKKAEGEQLELKMIGEEIPERGELPPGHPPIEGMMPAGKATMKGELPPGHPPIDKMMKGKGMPKGAPHGMMGKKGEATPEKAESPAEQKKAEEPKAQKVDPHAASADNLMVATYKVPGLDQAMVKKLSLALADQDGVEATKADIEAGLLKVTYSSGCPHGMGGMLAKVAQGTTLEGVTARDGKAPAKSGCGNCPKKDDCAGAH